MIVAYGTKAGINAAVKRIEGDPEQVRFDLRLNINYLIVNVTKRFVDEFGEIKPAVVALGYIGAVSVIG